MSEALLISSSGSAALTTAASSCDAITYFSGNYGTTVTLPFNVSKIVIGSFMNTPSKIFVPTPIACGIGIFNFSILAMQVSSTTPIYLSTTVWIELTASTLKLGLYNSNQAVSAFIFCYK